MADLSWIVEGNWYAVYRCATLTGEATGSFMVIAPFADGTVAPCCLSYDKSLSLGNIKATTLDLILEKNKDWISDLRDFTKLKDDVFSFFFVFELDPSAAIISS